MSDVLCACGAGPHPTAADRCARGHVQHGNQAARTDGTWALRRGQSDMAPAEVRQTVEDFRAAVTADRGGTDNLTTIEQAYIRRLSEVEAVVRLLAGELASKGLLTPRGRVKGIYGRWLDGIAAWDRLAQRVGTNRRSRPVLSATAILQGATRERD